MLLDPSQGQDKGGNLSYLCNLSNFLAGNLGIPSREMGELKDWNEGGTRPWLLALLQHSKEDFNFMSTKLAVFYVHI